MWVLLLAFMVVFGDGVFASPSDRYQTATFAGGCFWCMEPPFENLPGVIEVVAGYSGGTQKNPTYQDYAEKGYVEAVQITFDSELVSYPGLLDVFWRNIDPTDSAGQFVDRGQQYRSAIFYHTARQKQEAETSKKILEASKRFLQSIVTEIIPATDFYPAEAHHQNYYKKHSYRYKWYRSGSGRDRFLQKAWDAKTNSVSQLKNDSKYLRPSEAEIKKRLTPLQYQVTQQGRTEKAFDNMYWNTKQPGIYVDIVSGEPLFSSQDKFQSQTGWPSFSKSLESDNIVQKEDRGWFHVRIEVRSKHANSHLGHVFKDGPEPTGLRYCINSAALRFVPIEELEQEGYGEYRTFFDR